MAEQNIAVIVAHPDDEVLAFGGTMCRHAEHGDRVHVLFLATGLAARTEDGRVSAEEFEKLRAEAREAGKLMRVEQIEFAEFPDNRMDTVPMLDVVKRVSAFIEKTA